jgi:hypothetical protein
MKKVWIVVISIFMLLLIIFSAILIYNKLFWERTHPLGLLPSNQECYDSPLIADKVIDGDTFELCSGETVRLLCVDTPERGQEGYEEAKAFLEDLILDKELNLTTSNYNGNNTDKYGRLLRWVYVKNESLDSGELILVNKLIFDEGYGELMVIPPETCNEVAD